MRWPKKRKVSLFALSLLLCAAVNLVVFLFPHERRSPEQQQYAKVHTVTPFTNAGLLRPGFERGIVVPCAEPGEAPDASRSASISTTTAAQWIELPLLLTQPIATRTDMRSTLPLHVLADTIAVAHAHDYKVFLVPQMSVGSESSWSGTIAFSDISQQRAWFSSLFATYAPYLRLAQTMHVEQVSIGSELSWMQDNAPFALWESYIASVRAIYQGPLTYDTDWSNIVLGYEQGRRLPRWFSQSGLLLGVDAYIPLTNSPVPLERRTVLSLWRAAVQGPLDRFARSIHASVLVSEIGYRNTSTAGYRPWDVAVRGQENLPVQAALMTAALSSAFGDQSLLGTFWWEWGTPGPFNLANNTSAEHALLGWYSKKEQMT
jgi:hypothetical protein